MIASKRLGAARIVLLGSNPERVALGEEFGATDVVRERGDGAVERVRELTTDLGRIRCWSASGEAFLSAKFAPHVSYSVNI